MMAFPGAILALSAIAGPDPSQHHYGGAYGNWSSDPLGLPVYQYTGLCIYQVQRIRGSNPIGLPSRCRTILPLGPPASTYSNSGTTDWFSLPTTTEHSGPGKMKAGQSG